MCGIATITLAKTASPNLRLDDAVTALLLELDSRGGDACGMLAMSASGRISVQKASCAAAEFNRYRTPVPAGTRALLIHTRMATQGPASFMRNNHPVQSGRAHLIHNGVVWDDAVKRTPGEPEVDTFALSLIADAYAQKARKNPTPMLEAMGRLEGSAAIGVVWSGTPLLVTARCDYSPLYVAEAHGVRVCASTRDAVSDAFCALDLELDAREVERTKTRKKGRGKKAKTVVVKRWKEYDEAIDYCAPGEAFVWDAGQHSELTFRVVQPTYAARYGSQHAWKAYDEADAAWSLYDSHDDSQSDASADTRLGEIAARMLADMDRCELCDTWSEKADTHYRWGMLVCSECMHQMENAGADDAESADIGHA
jgi:predicted glutamine amidotransferase